MRVYEAKVVDEMERIGTGTGTRVRRRKGQSCDRDRAFMCCRHDVPLFVIGNSVGYDTSS